MGLFGSKKYSSINDLSDYVAKREGSRAGIDVRRPVTIAVIDDKDFSPLETLRANGFSITHFPDIPSIEAIKAFPIILCDLQGVGLRLNPGSMGVHIIREIKDSYPEKYVVAYTGGAGDPLVQEAITHADKYIEKDATITRWLEVLNHAINKATNPIEMWRAYRLILLGKGITPFELAQLEDSFVSSFRNGPDATKKNLLQKAHELGLNEDVRSVINNLVASAVWAALFGVAAG